MASGILFSQLPKPVTQNGNRIAFAFVAINHFVLMWGF